MAYSSDLNNVSPASQASVLYDLKETFKAAGYTIRGSGDGIAAHSAVGDIITSPGSGANGMDNVDAWFTVRQASGGAAPYSGTREWTFQRGTQAYNWFCQYSSPNTTFDQSTGNATTRPTLLLTQYLMNFARSDNASLEQTILPTGTTFTYQIRVGDSAEDFHWYCICYPNGGGNVSGRILNIPMSSDSITSANDEPFIVGAGESSLTLSSLASTSGNATDLYGWQGLNAPLGYPSPVSMTAFPYHDSAVGFIIPGALGSNPENGRDDGLPIVWGRNTAVLGNGFKGMSQKVKWTGTSRVTGDTLDSLNYIIFDETIWEWDGTTVPSV